MAKDAGGAVSAVVDSNERKPAIDAAKRPSASRRERAS
jgi:hypothetical protein